MADIEKSDIPNDNNSNLECTKPKSNVDRESTEISGDVSEHPEILVDDNEDELNSDSDEDSEGDKDTTGDTRGSDSDAIGNFWGDDESRSDDSSCESGQSGTGWGMIHFKSPTKSFDVSLSPNFASAN